MNEIIDKYKEFKNNRRNVGLVKLGFWILFFGIIILIAAMPTKHHSTVPSNNNKEDENEVINDSKTNYYFSYKINGQSYTGFYIDNNIILANDYISFYITNDDILMDKEDGVIPDYTYVNINVFYELMHKSELESTTSYKDGKEEYKYINKENDVETFITYIENTDESIDVIISKEDNMIEIHYFDFDKVENDIDKEKYTYSLKEVENEY